MKRLFKFLRREIFGIFEVIFLYSKPRKAHKVFERNINWILKQSPTNQGIKVSSKDERIYPEVTGYMIPSLRNWGMDDLADTYQEYLLTIQQADGGFLDPSGKTECIFDTGQIIRGFLTNHKNPQVRRATENAVDWIVSKIGDSGVIEIPEKEIWGGVVPDGIILYALEPALRASFLLEKKSHANLISKAISILLQNAKLTDLSSVNHFHAYIVEALVDLGRTDLAKEAMMKILEIQSSTGKIPATKESKWSCSTGQFQYAVILYKLGLISEANKTLEYAIKKQNRSGGWFGTLNRFASITSGLRRILPTSDIYFPQTEIPWANKYFLDACFLRQKLNFHEVSGSFPNTIEESDPRVITLKKEIEEFYPERVLDFGCGKGRYLRILEKNYPQISFHAFDISERVMSEIPDSIEKSVGTFCNSEYRDEEFDFIFSIEALEHALNFQGSIKELNRILKPQGKILIIDKNFYHRGSIRIDSWEQWFKRKVVTRKLNSEGFSVKEYRNIGYEKKSDRLFIGWLATKK